MRSSSPMASKEVDFVQGGTSRGIFGSLRREGSSKTMNNTRTLKNGSPDKKMSTIKMGGNSNTSGELKKYSQIIMQNQSHSEDLMNCDESNRM